MQRLDYPPIKVLDCDSQENWGHGTSLINFMKDVNIMELTVNGLTCVGTWNATDGFNITRTVSPIYYQENENFMNRTFRVITSLAEPYTMRRHSSTPLKGNEQFEGFAIDLIHELSQILGFNYTFTLQEDKMYDTMLDKVRNNVTTIKRVLKISTDLAIVDLTITSHRESVVDFTMPFMNLGISILYKRPTKAAPSLFSFMSPFNFDVWLCIMTNKPFKHVRELANQNFIKYGAKKSGSTVTFFRDSGDPIYHEDVSIYDGQCYLRTMMLTSWNLPPLSTSTERHCEVAQIGDLLDSKGYDSTYRNLLSTTVLKLQESGQLSKLKTKWWKEERGGGKCLEVRTSGNPSSLNLKNVGGVFVVLVVGLCLACVIAVMELLCNVYDTCRRTKVPFREELIQELKFIIHCHGSTKPIRKYHHRDRDSVQHDDSREFIHMSLYESSPYGINNTIMKEPFN
ncbi:hypothetical protein L9F63_017938 [Diploptera punctata]|uniref:Uncharacterized protein n=1 Tax=Diploptera punctata TaxID=6984 RepID=A0AAD8EG88_DIPPU|nr:hypothetical protein L9F63_017938 [Diploptera punctata]